MKNPYLDITSVKVSKPSRAQQALRESYLSICKTKDFAAVTVTELCKKAGVTRTTFYAAYPNTDALLCEIEDDLIAQLLVVNDPLHDAKQQKNDIPEQPAKESSLFVHNVMRFVEAQAEPLRTLLVIRSDSRLIDKWKRAVKYHFWESIGNNTQLGDFTLEIIAVIAIGGYTYLLEHPQSFDVKEMTHMLDEAMKQLQY